MAQEDTSSARTAPLAWWLPITAIAVSVVALAVYRPWEITHLSVRDQTLLLLSLPSGSSWSETFGALMERLQTEGRFYPLSSALFAFYGTAFERNAESWQWTRLVFTMAAAVLAYPTLRRLGAGVAGALCGAGLFLVGESVAAATNYVLIWESHGLPFFLGAA